MPIGLVVLGTSKSVEKPEGREGTYELRVDEVLYGSAAGKTVRFTHLWNAAESKPAIFALVPAAYDESYELKYVLDADELESQRALSAARLDFNVLSSVCVFVGKELDAGANYLHSVQVVRSLYGPALRAGQKVTVESSGYIRHGDGRPKVRTEEMIYLVSSTAAGRDIYEMPGGRDKETVYRLNTRLPVDLEAAVQESLARRNTYPVTESTEDGQTSRVREIVFRGTPAQAIGMMGSASDAAVTLAARRLIIDKATAGTEIFAALERGILKQKSDDPRTFRRLHNLIRLLVPLGENRLGGEAGRLVEKLIAHISVSTTTLPATTRPDRYWEREEARTDVNHSLAWLLMTMRPEDLGGALSERLVKLRDGCKGDWRREVQLALDAAKIEDTMELTAALARAKDAKPLRIGPAFRATGAEVVFSHDGRLLAAGASIWNVADWSEAGTFKNDASVAAMFFSPDDKSLYVLGGAAAPFNFRLDWRTGKREYILPEHKAGVTSATVSSDGTRMVTVSYYDDTVRLWELPACKLLRTFDLPRGCYHATLSPDGALLVHQTGKEELTAESLADGKSTKIDVKGGYELNDFLFTPDSKHLVVPTYNFSEMRLVLYSAGEGFRLEQTHAFKMNRCTGLAASPDSRHLVVADQDGRAEVLSLPDLKAVKTLLDQKTSDIKGNDIAFTADGNLLVIGSRYDMARLFAGKTFDRIQPSAGHGGKVSAIHFSADGKALRSIGSDNTACLWDAASGKMQSRIALPPGYQVVSARGDGRYLVCHESRALENSSQYGDDQTNAARIIEADTGKICCEPALPMGRFGTKVHWIDDHQAVVATWTHICIFDYLTGKIVKDTKIDRSDLGNGMGELTEDGKSIYIIEGGGKGQWVEARLIDIRTGQAKELGKQELASFTGNSRGLVPGGKYFFIGDPGLYIFDRASLSPVGHKDFRDTDLLHTAFASDGGRYATVAGGRIFIDEGLRQYDPKTQSVVRVGETLTGKTTWAVMAPTRWVRDLVFAPGGHRLAAVGDDGAIVVWDIKD
jgi:WD40 repeat protein